MFFFLYFRNSGNELNEVSFRKLFKIMRTMVMEFG